MGVIRGPESIPELYIGGATHPIRPSKNLMTDPANTEKVPVGGRWWQLIVGIICMSMIANLQYGWTLFVNPIADKHHWTKPAIQVAFTLFVLIETWLVPI